MSQPDSDSPKPGPSGLQNPCQAENPSRQSSSDESDPFMSQRRPVLDEIEGIPGISFTTRVMDYFESKLNGDIVLEWLNLYNDTRNENSSTSQSSSGNTTPEPDDDRKNFVANFCEKLCAKQSQAPTRGTKGQVKGRRVAKASSGSGTNPQSPDWKQRWAMYKTTHPIEGFLKTESNDPNVKKTITTAVKAFLIYKENKNLVNDKGKVSVTRAEVEDLLYDATVHMSRQVFPELDAESSTDDKTDSGSAKEEKAQKVKQTLTPQQKIARKVLGILLICLSFCLDNAIITEGIPLLLFIQLLPGFAVKETPEAEAARIANYQLWAYQDSLVGIPSIDESSSSKDSKLPESVDSESSSKEFSMEGMSDMEEYPVFSSGSQGTGNNSPGSESKVLDPPTPELPITETNLSTESKSSGYHFVPVMMSTQPPDMKAFADYEEFMDRKYNERLQRETSPLPDERPSKK